MDAKEFAKHLRKPEGEVGINVGKSMNEGNAKMYNLALETIPFEEGDVVLEIGLGNGKFIPDVLAKAKEISFKGLDYSETMVAEATKLIYEKGLGVRAEVLSGTVSDIPFSDNYFDKIFTVNTIYFWENPESDIREIYRVLKKGGYFYLLFRPKEIAEKLEVTKYGFRLYTLQEALSLMQSAGFLQIEVKYQEEQTATINGAEVKFASYCVYGLK